MTGACLVLGAGGRVGRLLRGAWPEASGGTPALFHSRAPAAGIDLVAPLEPRLATSARSTPVSTVLVLPGVTYGTDTDLACNTDFALTGLEIAKALNAKAILCSSAAVYRARPGHPPFVEAEGDAPDRPYGQAKRAMERAAARWHAAQSDPLPILCLRMANVPGADLLGQIAGTATKDKPLKLDRFPDGSSPRRSYLSPKTLAAVIAAFARATLAPDLHILNLADPGPPIEMAALLRAMERLGRPVPWTWVPAPETAIPEVALNLDALARALPDSQVLGRPATAETLVGDWFAAAGNIR